MKNKSNDLPGIARWSLRRLFDDVKCEAVTGDFEEAYFSILEERGSGAADRWLASEILKAARGKLFNDIFWAMSMLTGYMKISGRNIMKQKIYSFINIAGLALGITCCMLIFLYVHHELSYDRHIEGGDRVYRIYEEINNKATTRTYVPIAGPVVPVIMERHPARIESAARVLTWFAMSLVSYEEKSYYEERFYFADEDILDIFSIPFIKGDPSTALSRPGTIVITEKIAGKYFSGENPLGKVLRVNDWELEVTGVVEDSPLNTHLKYDLFASMRTIESDEQRKGWLENWYGTTVISYVKLRENTDVAGFASSIEFIADDFIGEALRNWEETRRFPLQPVVDIHLKSNLIYEVESPGSVPTIIILSGIGMLVLVIACLNFINLSTARSATRAREVGLRKVIGSRRGQLIGQFLYESTSISLVAAALAVALLWILLPSFNSLAGSSFTISDAMAPVVIAGLFSIVVLCGLGAGMYPAFFLSSFSPAATLKGRFTQGNKGRRLRTGLVIVQFAISIVLIIGTLVIREQIDFMKGQYLGFEKEQKLCIAVRGNASLATNREAVLGSFMEHHAVNGVSTSSSIPGRELANYSIQVMGQAEDFNQGMLHMFIDPEFLDLYKIDVIAGRNFLADMTTDLRTGENTGSFVINEAATRALGFDDPQDAIGAVLRTGRGGVDGPVIGVTRDFHFTGLQNIVEPIVLQWDPRVVRVISLDIDTAGMETTLAGLQDIWKGFFPDTPYEHVFLDEDFNRVYLSEERVGRITGVFTLVGIIIASLGLLGLTSFAAEQRRKEIGVRKVLGASVLGINMMLIKDFTRWVLIANLIAWPVAWFVMDKWLDGFATRTGIDIWIFLLSGLIALAAALATVSFQSTRAALSDPIECLRYE